MSRSYGEGKAIVPKVDKEIERSVEAWPGVALRTEDAADGGLERASRTGH